MKIESIISIMMHDRCGMHHSASSKHK